MSIRLPDIDGEWELWNGDGVSDEWDRSNFRILKRIPPKEKSLYERCIQAERDDGYTAKALADEKATLVLCQTIESLEKRVEELAVLERKATEDHYRLLRRLEVLEKCRG